MYVIAFVCFHVCIRVRMCFVVYCYIYSKTFILKRIYKIIDFKFSIGIYWPISISRLIFVTFRKTNFSLVINLKFQSLLTVFTKPFSNDTHGKS